MNFVLFLMFFAAAPAAPKDRVWTLQSTTTMEFASKAACDVAVKKSILPSVQSTDTVAFVGWCFSKGTGEKALIEAATPAGPDYQWPPAKK